MSEEAEEEESRIEEENEEGEEQEGVFDENITNELNPWPEIEGRISPIDGEDEVAIEQGQKLLLADDDDEEEIPVDEEDDNHKFVLVSTGARVVSIWIGTATPDNFKHSHHAQQYKGTTNLGNNEMMYYMVKLAWKKISVAQHKQQRRERLERLRSKELMESLKNEYVPTCSLKVQFA
jgi:hypothetical protein